MERRLPRDGDVLVSHPMARVECEIAIVPRSAHAVDRQTKSALPDAVELTQALGVDAWLTHDRRHFLPIASFRSDGPMMKAASTMTADAPHA